MKKQISTFENPAAYYTHDSFKNLEIDSFIVPLYKRIFLDVFKARKLIFTILNDMHIGYVNNISKSRDKSIEKVVLRCFLSSSRSYKKRIHNDAIMNIDLKNLLLNTAFPKFIWVAELTSPSEYEKEKGRGLVILDATGNDSTDSIIFLMYPGVVFYEKDGEVKKLYIDLDAYSLYRNNLKGEWCNYEG